MSQRSLQSLLKSHLVDLQLANDPAQYLVARVLARLTLLEYLLEDHLKELAGENRGV